jgi:dTDP-4-dehydrorhamnose reductase
MRRLLQERDTLVLSRIKSDSNVCSRFGSGDDGHSYSTGMDPRIYNYSNEGEISWYEFVLAIQEIGGYSCEVNGIPSSSYLLLQNVPPLLDKTKIKRNIWG